MLACMQREERAAVREMPAAFELHPEQALRSREEKPDFSDEYLSEIAAPRAVISGRPRQPMRMSFLFTNSSAP